MRESEMQSTAGGQQEHCTQQLPSSYFPFFLIYVSIAMSDLTGHSLSPQTARGLLYSFTDHKEHFYYSLLQVMLFKGYYLCAEVHTPILQKQPQDCNLYYSTLSSLNSINLFIHYFPEKHITLLFPSSVKPLLSCLHKRYPFFHVSSFNFYIKKLLAHTDVLRKRSKIKLSQQIQFYQL